MMRAPPSLDRGESHASLSPPLKREDGGRKSDETNTVLSYRNCTLTQYARPANPQARTPPLAEPRHAPRLTGHS